MTQAKADARKAAFAARKAAHGRGADLTDVLVSALSDLTGDVIAGYWPIRTEVDTRAALARLSQTRRIVLPVVEGEGQPLSFRYWMPEAEMIEGAFGAAIPAQAAGAAPDILIVPLLAFDARGYRLGYGGGFYDRTLEGLRAKRQTLALGLAYAAQEVAEVPTEPTDQPLDLIVTEAGVRAFR